METCTDGLSTLLTFGEGVLVQEKYGLSVTFHVGQLEWEAVDPDYRYRASGPTPCAAIFGWDELRRKDED